MKTALRLGSAEANAGLYRGSIREANHDGRIRSYKRANKVKGRRGARPRHPVQTAAVDPKVRSTLRGIVFGEPARN
jgi:hypothetical protein